MSVAEREIVSLGCGDAGPIHEPVSAYSTLAKAVLAAADIRFAQVERVYSERGANLTAVKAAKRRLQI